MKKHGGKIIVVTLMLCIVGGLCYLLLGVPSMSAEEQQAPPVPTAPVERGSIAETVSGPGELKGASVEKLKAPKWRYFKKFVAPLNTRIPAGTPLVEYTYGDPLVAPYDLVVLSKSLPAKEREELTDEHYVEVSRVDAMHVELNASETDIAKLAVGQSVNVTLSARSGEVFSGSIVGIDEVGSYSATGSKYKVTVEIPNDGGILIGMSANVNIIVAEAADVLSVPVSAIIDSATDGSSVLVERPDGTQKLVAVETGLSDGVRVEILNGLSEGDVVVLQEVALGDTEGSGPSGAKVVMSVG